MPLYRICRAELDVDFSCFLLTYFDTKIYSKSAQGLLFGAISYYILSKRINNVDTDVKKIKKILPGADVE